MHVRQLALYKGSGTANRHQLPTTSLDVSAGQGKGALCGLYLDLEFSCTQHVNGLWHLISLCYLFQSGRMKWCAVQGLEPEMQRLMGQHQAELQAAKQAASDASQDRLHQLMMQVSLPDGLGLV